MATVLWWILVPFYVIACLALVIIVLLQKGKGVGFAGAFGVGSGSDTVFGPRTTQNLVHKLTYIGAGVFMSFAMIMALISGKVGRGSAPDLIPEKSPEAPALQEVLGETPSTPVADNTAPISTTQAIQIPAPAAETPAPAAETPAPAAETPAPAAETPAPAAQ